MATQDPPLDEIVASRPEIIEWWMSGNHGFPNPTFPDERLIHQYFSEVQFFDWSTKNGSAMQQAQKDWAGWMRVHDRKAFEDALRQQIGTEYAISGEPQPIHSDEKGSTNGMWIIRKLDRVEQDKSPDMTNPYPQTELLGTYYMVGPNVYQAPSVADVVENRMLGVATSLSDFFEKAKSLPRFSPTTGHTYLPQTSKHNAATGSTNASPTRSREGSIAPGTDTQSLRSSSVVPDGQAGGTASSGNAQDARLLAQSLQMAIHFSDEFMDENPIVGEPGSFKFTSTTAAVKKRKADEEAAAAKAREQKDTASRATSTKPSPRPEKAPSPPAIFTEAKAGPRKDKESRDEKKKRRRSRPNPTSPTTPVSATSATAPQSTS